MPFTGCDAKDKYLQYIQNVKVFHLQIIQHTSKCSLLTALCGVVVVVDGASSTQPAPSVSSTPSG